MINIQPSTTLFGDYRLHGDRVFDSDVDNAVSVLFMHGAGKAERGRFLPLRELLLKDHGVASYAFDFIGHGETGGELLSSSLQQRTEQALAVIKQHVQNQPLVLIGASMSAYTAVKLTEYVSVKGLMLMVPAAYSDKAYSVQFGQPFSDILRTRNSWEQSDAWQLAEDFTGRVAIISAQQDEVIPTGIVQCYLKSASQTADCTHIDVQGSTHQLLKHLNDHPDKLPAIAQLIASSAQQ